MLAKTMSPKPVIIFVTTDFDNIDNGPGTFTQYLWDTFSEDKDLEFHVVAASHQIHPRITNYLSSASSAEYYKNMQNAMDQTVSRLKSSRHRPIVHCNIPHAIARFPTGSFNIAQANDYDAVHLMRNLTSIYHENSARRIATMCWRRWRERRIFRTAELVLANSEFTRQAILKGYRLDPQRVQRVYKAVDIERFYPLANDKNGRVDIRNPKLIFIGSNWIRKGFDLLIEALVVLHREGVKPELVVVGPPDAHRNQDLVNAVKASAIASQVEFMGRVTRGDLPAILWQCDVGILPSRHEALGVAVIEFMASGLPVVASNTGGIPEIVTHEKNGLLFESGSVKSLCEAIRKILHLGYHRRLQRNASLRAQDFSKKKMTDTIKKIYLSA